MANLRQYRTTHRSRGAALITAMIFTVVITLLVAGGLAYVLSNFRLTTARRDSEAALQLAEAGINNEFNYITKNLYAPVVTDRSSQPIQINGEPFIGRHGTIDGVNGHFWVFTSLNPTPPYQAWTGGSTLYITCNAVVNGAQKRVVVGGENVVGKIFDIFALFGLDTGNENNAPSIALTGNANVEVIGTVGTNGHVQKGSGTISYLKAINYNQNYYAETTKEQFTSEPVFVEIDRLRFPVVVEVLRTLFPATSGMSDAATWSYVQGHSENASKILQWKPGLAAGTPLSPSNVMAAGFPSNRFTLSNSKGNTLGDWETLNPKPGSKTVRTMIFPPGDYFFENITLVYKAESEIIIDNAGLSVGGNPTQRQVRFFLYGNSTRDSVGIPLQMTAPTNAKLFRIYDGKDGSVFQIARDSHVTGEYTIAGCIYAATARIGHSYLKGVQISVEGGPSATQRTVVLGSLLADRIEFSNFCRIVFPDDSGNNEDPPISVGFLGNYWEF